ncbi:MAG: hypothetical protein U9P63_00530 [Patescibacteria group bacterium]|nr:hypothetical protein [Patescibacteria group bacterium]
MMPFLKKKIISFIVLGLTVLGLVFAAVVYPLIGKIAEASRQYQANREILAGFDKRESLAKELQRDFQQQQNRLSKIDGILLSQEETVGFILTLEEIAQKTGNLFEIKDVISPVPSAGEEPFLSLRATLHGDFAELLNFIAKLEDSPYPPYRLIEIDNLNIKRLTKTNLNYLGAEIEEGNLETNIGIKIYTK